MREKRPGLFKIRISAGFAPVSGRTRRRSSWFHGAPARMCRSVRQLLRGTAHPMPYVLMLANWSIPDSPNSRPTPELLVPPKGMETGAPK